MGWIMTKEYTREEYVAEWGEDMARIYFDEDPTPLEDAFYRESVQHSRLRRRHERLKARLAAKDKELADLKGAVRQIPGLKSGLAAWTLLRERERELVEAKRRVKEQSALIERLLSK